MKKTFKYVFVALLGLCLVFIFVANFSSKEHRYECIGSFKSQKRQLDNEAVFLKLSVYMLWVGLWSDSDASLNIEIPNEFVDYYGNIKKVGDQFQVYDFDGNLKGTFSALSKTLALQTHLGFYDGLCKKLDD